MPSRRLRAGRTSVSTGGTDPRQALTLIASCARTAEQAARRMLRLARGDAPDDDLTVLDVSQLTS